VSKVVLGILTGILIFVAAGILATYWVGKMRREMEQKRPQVAQTVERAPEFRGGRLDSGLPVLAIEVS
jgi:flagellar basal body-associated protein FliL